MNKTAAKLLVVFFASLLVLLLVYEILTLSESVTQTLSSVEFNQVENGLYERSVFGISAKIVETSQPVFLENDCTCTVELHQAKDHSKHCKIWSAPFPSDPNYVSEALLTKTPFLSVSSIEGPVNFKMGELLRITCLTEQRANFGIMSLPMTLEYMLNVMSDPTKAVEFFDKYFKTRPQRILSGGQNILMKLRSMHFQDLNGHVGIEGRHIYSHITTTSTGNDSLTEFVVTWQSPVYVLVKRFKLGNYLQIAKLLATFLLSVELLFAMYGRFT